jgi:hypothetical protein
MQFRNAEQVSSGGCVFRERGMRMKRDGVIDEVIIFL